MFSAIKHSLLIQGISITTKLIELSFLSKLYKVSGMVLVYFIFDFKPYDSFSLFYSHFTFEYRDLR